MKHSLLILAITLFSFCAYCQSNTSFENWTTSSGQQYEDPDNWSTFNYFSANGANISCTKSENAHWGNYSAQLITVNIPAFSTTFAGSLLQSTPLTKRIKSFSIYYKYSGTISDSASISVSFYKGRVIIDSLMGSGLLYFGKNTNWTKISGNIQWQNAFQPDTMLVFINSSFSSITDTLIVDDFEISDFSTEISDVVKPSINVLGTSNSLTIANVDVSNGCHVILRNMLGQVVVDKSTYSSSMQFDPLPSGVYTYELSLDGIRNAGKVVITN